MVFKRRKARPLWQVLWDLVYPRGGWRRAFYYVRHRLNRLPDTPSRIARGMAVGVFCCYTPLFGLHFVLSVVVAKIIRGNAIASLLATFYGNPITFPIIAAVNLKLGHLMLGTEQGEGSIATLWEKFAAAGDELRDNVIALVTDGPSDWDSLADFYADIWLPYLVGGLGPGVVSGVIAYYLMVPLITAYQNHRRAKTKRTNAVRRAGGKRADTGPGPG